MSFQHYRQRKNRFVGALPCLLALCLIVTEAVSAAPPAPFSAEYEARYGGFRANAERSLSVVSAGNYEMNTLLELKLLGQTISSIEETSVLATDQEGVILPSEYTFEQRGLGKRRRHISFDWDSETAITSGGNEENILTLDGKVSDNLSSFLVVRDQLLAGRDEVLFPGIDKGSIQEFRYQVIGEEELDTELGPLNTLKLERVRDPGNDRSTEMWLALDWDYLLVRLVQKEPGTNTIRLELKQATVNEDPVSGLQDAAAPPPV